MTRRGLFGAIAGALCVLSKCGTGSYTKDFLAANPGVKPFPKGILITGHRPSSGATEAYLKELMDKYRAKLIASPPLTEEERTRYLSIMEDIWLPRRINNS